MRLILVGPFFLSILIVQQTLAQQPSASLGLVSQSEKQETAKWDDYTAVFRDINASLPELRSMFGEKNQEALKLLEDIRSSNGILEKEWQEDSKGAWQRVWETPTSGNYRDAKARWEIQTMTPKSFFVSLKTNLLILQSISKKEVKEEAVMPLLKSVVQDLRIKATHCQRNGWASLITVTVLTKKDGYVREGYEVSYVDKGWASDPSKWLAFPKLSTAFKDLPPGIYMIRVKGLEAISIEIDGNGTTKQEVELKVP